MLETLDFSLVSFTAMSPWEYLAALLACIYLLLVVKENVLCWPIGFVSTLIYTLLYWNGALHIESSLNLYYMLMAIVGWYMWRPNSHRSAVSICSWSLSMHLTVISGTSLVAVLTGWFIDSFINAELAYLGSFTTCFAVVATYLVTQKVLENWLYWIVVDTASMYLYFLKGYYPTLVLYVFYILMVCWGYKCWYEKYELANGKKLGAL